MTLDHQRFFQFFSAIHLNLECGIAAVLHALFIDSPLGVRLRHGHAASALSSLAALAPQNGQKVTRIDKSQRVLLPFSNSAIFSPSLSFNPSIRRLSSLLHSKLKSSFLGEIFNT
jgi:hypothetical protein